MEETIPLPDLNDKQKRRFWYRVWKTEECWVWQGGLYKDGYGQTCWNYIKCRTHRLAYKLCHGIDPGPYLVLHTCDNRRCVRPDHLFLGTKKDNAQDAIAKGRHPCCHFSETNHPALKHG